jgi:hypothetical protein
MSIGNIFWEDMFAHVPESKDWVLKINGQPVPYGTADYGAVGQVTRYLADLSLEAWQQYTLGRVVAAVQAGADGIMFNNNSSYYSRDLLEQFTARALKEARKIKVFEQDATSAKLSQYLLVIAAPSVVLRPQWRRYEELRPEDLAAASPVAVSAPDSVLVNMHGQSTGRTIVHLLNYGDTTAIDIDLKLPGRFSSAQLLSPDIEAGSIPLSTDGSLTQLRVPELRTYDLVVL